MSEISEPDSTDSILHHLPDSSALPTAAVGDASKELREPKLKYRRLNIRDDAFWRRDSVSAFYASAKVLAMGTHWGLVFLLDIDGNMIRELKPAHSACVTRVQIDSSGDWLISASDDGTVHIHHLFPSAPDNAPIAHQQAIIISYSRPIKCISMDPLSFASSKQFVVGGLAGKLIMHDKGWFSSSRETILFESEEPIYNVDWHSSYVVWADEVGVKVLDTSSQILIYRLDYPANSPRPDLYPCCFHWKGDDTLLITWTNTFRTLSLKKSRSTSSLSALTTASHSSYAGKFTILKEMKTDCVISGVGVLGDCTLLLGYPRLPADGVHDANMDSPRPELRILDSHDVEIGCDSLSISSFGLMQAHDYHLVPNDSDGLYYFVSPKEVVQIRILEGKDRVNWLLKRKEYLRALQIITTENVFGFDMSKIRNSCMQMLVEQNRFDSLMENCAFILNDERMLWRKWTTRLAELGKLKFIGTKLPIDKFLLDKDVYEMALAYFLVNDVEMLVQLLEVWPSQCYDNQAVTALLKRSLNTDSTVDERKLRALELVYAKSNDHEGVIECKVKQGKEDSLDLVEKFAAFNVIVKFLPDFMALDEFLIAGSSKSDAVRPTIKFIVLHSEHYPPHKIVPKLRTFKKACCQYLDALFRKNPHDVEQFHQLLLELYVDTKSDRLLDFLKDPSAIYDIGEGLRLCSKLNLLHEQVAVLHRVGDIAAAMKIILEDISDPYKAIDFAKETGDNELWNMLLNYSLDKPQFISAILESGAALINPGDLIMRISKKGLTVPNLRESLIRIVQEYHLQVSLLEGCQAIFVKDAIALLGAFVQKSRSGNLVDLSLHSCASCGEAIVQHVISEMLKADAEGKSDLVIFFCSHLCHAACVVSPNSNSDKSLKFGPANPKNSVRCPVCET